MRMLTTILFFVMAVMLFRHLRWRFRRHWDIDRRFREGLDASGPASWHEEWQRHWAGKWQRQEQMREWHMAACHPRHRERDRRRAERRARREEGRHARREERRSARSANPATDTNWNTDASRDANPGGSPGVKYNGQSASGGRSNDAPPFRPAASPRNERAEAPPAGDRPTAPPPRSTDSRDDAILRRARRRAVAEVGFYSHLMTYIAVIGFLAVLNLMTGWHGPHGFSLWFIWPAFGWGIGLFSHFMGVFGKRMLQDRYFYPAIEREVRRQTSTVRTEKQASIDELSATIAHEIRNPIAAAKSLVQQMGEDPRSVENVEYAEVALGELDRVERSISHLLRYSKEEALEFAPTNLAGVVDEALKEMRAKLDGAHVAVARNYITGPTIVGDAEKLRQVFANILDNAIDAFPADTPDRRIDLFVENGVLERARVRVVDNGAGIPPEKIDRIFNPFFTTKEKGTGLGMAISKKIVEAHEGTIDVVSEPGRGTEFVITLPLPH